MPDRERDPGVASEIATERLNEPPAGTRQSYALAELAALLDAPAEKVRMWLADGDVHPLADDAPDDYGIDAVEYVRTLGHQF